MKAGGYDKRAVDARSSEIFLLGGDFRELNGEGVYPTLPQRLYLDLLPVIGVRRRRRMSEAQRAKAAERLKRAVTTSFSANQRINQWKDRPTRTH